MSDRAHGAPPADEGAPLFDTSKAQRARRELFETLLADEPFQDEEPEAAGGPPSYVTAVLVAHNGARWLPTTLASLRVQTRAPEQVVAVDTGSIDASAQLLTRALGTRGFVQAGEMTGYGQAVASALAAAEVSLSVRAGHREWIWLLHDDSAPEPDALERLLEHAERNPSVSILGAKAVDWDHPDRLVDIGQSTDAAGRRETFLEPGEIDQGQHERPRDVLAVGTAGALVRRETWDALHGFDPTLPLLREDIDFGWRAVRSGRRVAIVPSARIRHARATLTGLRDGSLVGRVGRTDRAHALYVSVLDGGGWGGLLRLPRLALGVLLRAMVLLLTRRVVAAYEELLAGVDVLAHPGRLLAGRRWRRGQLTLPSRAARPLLSRGSTRLRAALLATTDRLSGAGEIEALARDQDDGLPDSDANVVRRLLVRPGFVLIVVLLVVALVADRHLLRGGALTGGRLLPVDGGADDLWHTYVAGWHDVGAGSGSPASPWLPLLALASLPFGGDPAAALTVLVLGAVPLAGLSAWWATRRLRLSVGLRWWAAATYALLPPVTGALDGGRFDALVAVVALPMLVAAGVRLQRGQAGSHVFALGLGIAATAAFSPPVWSLAAVLLLASGLLSVATAPLSGRPWQAATTRLGEAVCALAVTPLVLLPWSLSVVHHPRVLVVGLGGPGGLASVAARPVGAADVLLLSPGGPRAMPLWVVAPVLLAAVAACLRASRSRAAASALAVAAIGMLGGLLAARVGASATGRPPQGWSGVGLGLASAALVGGALLAAQGVRRALRGSSFGIHQPLSVLLALMTAAVPFVAASWLVVHGAGDPLHRADTAALPSIVVDNAATDPGQRVLTLRTVDGRVAYSLTRVAGARLGDEDLSPSPASSTLLNHLVADLTSDRGTDAAETLATFHVRYVALDEAAAGDLAGVLDRQPALSRYALPGDVELWQLLVPSARLEIVSGAVADVAADPAPAGAALGRGPTLDQLSTAPIRALTAGPLGVHVSVPTGSGDRLLVLADSADGRWRASLDGTRLTPVTAWGWAQAFRLPAGGGTLQLSYDAGERHLELWLQALAVLVAVVLAAPGVRRPEEEPAGPVAATLEPDELWTHEEVTAAALATGSERAAPDAAVDPGTPPAPGRVRRRGARHRGPGPRHRRST